MLLVKISVAMPGRIVGWMSVHVRPFCITCRICAGTSASRSVAIQQRTEICRDRRHEQQQRRGEQVRPRRPETAREVCPEERAEPTPGRRRRAVQPQVRA